MSQPSFQSLPPKLRYEIYNLAFGPSLNIEILPNNHFSCPECPFLRVNRSLREDILTAYSTEIVWIFKSPAALANASPALHRLHASASQPVITTIQLVLLNPLGDGSLLTHDERGGSSDGPNIAPLYKAWRDVVAGLPVDMSVQCVKFDLTHSWTWESLSVARLVHNLSAVLHRKYFGVRFEIVGCKTEAGREFVEQSTVGLAKPSSRMRRRGFGVGAE